MSADLKPDIREWLDRTLAELGTRGNVVLLRSQDYAYLRALAARLTVPPAASEGCNCFYGQLAAAPLDGNRFRANATETCPIHRHQPTGGPTPAASCCGDATHGCQGVPAASEPCPNAECTLPKGHDSLCDDPASEPSDEAVARELARWSSWWSPDGNLEVVRAVNAARERARGKR